MHEDMLIFTREREEEVEHLNTTGDQEAASCIYPVEQAKRGEHVDGWF